MMLENTYFVIIHKQICCLKIPVNYVVLMQVLYSTVDINCKLKQLREIQDNVILVYIFIKASSRHVLCKQDEKTNSLSVGEKKHYTKIDKQPFQENMYVNYFQQLKTVRSCRLQ